MFTLRTLIENVCVEGKLGTMSQVLELISIQDKLSKEVEKKRIK